MSAETLLLSRLVPLSLDEWRARQGQTGDHTGHSNALCGGLHMLGLGSGILGGVALEEEVRHWRWALRFEKPILGTVGFFLSLPLSLPLSLLFSCLGIRC